MATPHTTALKPTQVAAVAPELVFSPMRAKFNQQSEAEKVTMPSPPEKEVG